AGSSTQCPGGTCGDTVCYSGRQPQMPLKPCRTDLECPGAECGPALFDFRDRAVAGVGPVTVRRHVDGVCDGGVDTNGNSIDGNPCTGDGDCGGGTCVQFRARGTASAPIEGLLGTDELFALIKDEGRAGKDINCDTDSKDKVIELHDQRTKKGQPLGKPSTGACEAEPDCCTGDRPPGRAIQTVPQPVVAVEKDVLAFGEHDPDYSAAATLLAAFNLAQPDELPENQQPPLTIDLATDPVVNHESLAIVNGRVWYRTSDGTLAFFDTATAGTRSFASSGIATTVAVTGNSAAFSTSSGAVILV